MSRKWSPGSGKLEVAMDISTPVSYFDIILDD